jgi:hypothetical protein
MLLRVDPRHNPVAHRFERFQGVTLSQLRQVECSASVGVTRAARMAGYSPAMAPMISAAPKPPASPIQETTAAQPWLAA